MPQPKILFISKRASAPSTRYRALQYGDLFEDAGWLFTHIADDRSLKTRAKILKEAKRSHVVVIVRRTYSYLFLKLLRLTCNYLVYDFDDAVFQKSHGQGSLRREKNFNRVVSLADQIWAGNSYLANRARQMNEKVLIVPTSLDVQKYSESANKPDNYIDLVWIGSSSTKKHLVTALPALEKAAGRIPSLRLKIIADFSLHSDVLTIVPVQWSEESEVRELVSAHIGIAPLPDNLYTRGKCALKVIQYMAAGLPVISSPTGVNKEIIEDGGNGFLVASDNEWITAIEKLAKDQNLRHRFGERGRTSSLENFSLQATFRKMVDSLKKCL